MAIFQLRVKKNLQDYIIKQDEEILFETERDRLIRPRRIDMKGNDAKIYLASSKFGFGEIQHQIREIGTDENLGTILVNLGFFNKIYIEINKKKFHLDGGGLRNWFFRSICASWIGVLILRKKKIIYPLIFEQQQVGTLKISIINKAFEVEDKFLHSLNDIEKQALFMGITLGGF